MSLVALLELVGLSTTTMADADRTFEGVVVRREAITT